MDDKTIGMAALVLICGISAWALGTDSKEILLTCVGAIGGLVSGSIISRKPAP